VGVNLDELVARLRLDSSGFDQGLGRVQSSMSKVGGSMTSVGKRMSLGITAPIAGIAAAGISLEASFSSTMRQVAIATGGPTTALSALAKKMGAETVFSANDAAQAMLELAKGGMTAVQVQGGALQATMKLASAGGIDLASSSTYVANALNTFGINASKADSVAVALAGAANASSASVDSLGQGLSQGALAAKNAGLSLQETVGVLSEFDAAGLKGSDAGTSLKTMLNSLTPTTDKAKNAMKDLGLNFVNADGSFVSVANTAQQLHDKLGPLSEAQRSVALETIFGTDGMRAASVLMDGGAKAVNKYTKASKDQATTTKLANAAMQGTSGAIESAKGSIETMLLTVGETLAPFTIKVAKGIAFLTNAFTNAPKSVKIVAIAIAGIAAAIGPLLVVIGALTIALGAVSLPVVGIVLGLVALGAALVAAYQSSATFRDIVNGAFASIVAYVQTSLIPMGQRIVTAFMQLVAVVLPIIMQLVAVVRANLPQIQQVVTQVFSTVGSIITAAMTAVLTIVRVATWTITTLWNIFGGTILALVQRVFPAVLTVIKGVLNIIQGVVRAFTAILHGDWSALWSALGQIVKGAGQVIGGVVRALWAVVRAIFSAGGAALKAIASSIWSGVKAVFSGAVSGIVAIVRRIVSDIKSTFTKLPGQLATIGGQIIDGLKGGIEAAGHKVMDAVNAIVDKIPKFIRKKLGIASPSKVTQLIGKQVVQGLIKGLSGPDVGEMQQQLAKITSIIEKVGAIRHTPKSRTQAVLASLGAERGALLSNANAWASVRASIDAATSSLNDQLTARANLSSSLANDATGSIINSGATSAVTIEAQLQRRLAAANTFGQNFAALQQMGASDSLLKQIADAGVTGGSATAQALVSAGPDAVRRISTLQDTLSAAAGRLGDSVSHSMYDAGIAASQGLIAGLSSQSAQLQAAARALAAALVKATKRKLGIRSPSRVFAGIGANVGAGMAVGIDSSQRRVAASVRQLVAIPSTADVNTTGVGAGAGGISVPVTIHAPQMRSDEALAKLIGGRVAGAVAGHGVVPVGG
jgi:TP901 family phage tail tape measure protein